MSGRFGTTSGRLKGAVVPVVLLLLAEIYSLATGVQSAALAAPHEIVVAFFQALADGSLLVSTLQTLGAALSGMAIGASFGILVGTVLGISQTLDRLLFVSIELVRAIPAIAFIPIVMLMVGFGYRLEIYIVTFATFWPTLLLSRAAVASIEPRLLEVANVLGLGTIGAMRKIILPAMLPRIFVALRLASSVALIVAVTVEVAANPIGLGHGLMSAQQALNPAKMLMLLCWLGVLGLLLNYALLLVQRKLFSYSPAQDDVR